MKYFIDTEFLEGTQRYRKTFWEALLAIKINTPPTIDLISIGIVCEDGREYYAISKEFNLIEAWNRYEDSTPTKGLKLYWIRDNILKPIFDEFYIDVFNCSMPTFNYKSFKYLINKIGKSNKQIAEEIKDFVSHKNDVKSLYWFPNNGNELKSLDTYKNRIEYLEKLNRPLKFYGYYSDYDWVVFCWLFGRMIDLPKGFPMYCIDLKQELERLNEVLGYNFDEKGNSYKIQNHTDYPKQTNEHNALADAKWNFELYKFLKNFNNG
jgi:hypothetical protein